MSNLAYAAPNRRPVEREPEHPRHIEIVPSRAQKRARPRVAYAVVTVASLFAIFAAQLLLSIVVSDGAYQISALQSQQKELLREQDALSEQLDLLGSSQHLAANAAALGMVPGSSPLFLDVSSGGIAPAPGTIDRVGCGGTCNLVLNSLLTGMPLVTTAPAQDRLGPQGTTTTTTTTTNQTTGTTPPAAPTAPVDALPAPVTH
ncbi:hypothetical protein [Antiquaquibacter soli]|uniref:Cell division protein FtsL n=1 Tax=Antiquaquibacter soli TaxID=3064523 RepID=A0ABT9BLE1_9MICO|nr:hypothetical protein [Protaetiibacter sp. WY-16]MDO7881826.1 hypothetical protein [Protaetiibacter sp. WY-16]